MAEVGIEGFAAGDDEKDGAEDGESDPAILSEKAQAMERIEGREDDWLPNDREDAEQPNGQEPDKHDRPEDEADALCPVPLKEKEHEQNRKRDRDDEMLQRRSRDLQPLDRAQDGNGRSNHAVAIEQSRPENAQTGEPEGAPPRRCMRARSARMPPSPLLSARIT
jgi:hypothetical protein